MDEAETGLKSSLAVKVFGPDLKTLESKGKAIKKIVEKVRGIKDVTLVQELGQPSLAVNINRAKIARYGLNVADINGLIQAAIGGTAATQVVQGEKQFDLVVRLDEQYRGTPEQIGGILVATPDGQQIPLAGIRRHPGGERRCLYLSRKQFPLHRRAIFRGRTRPGRGGQRRPRPGQGRRALAGGLLPGLGRRIYRIYLLARLNSASFCP